MTVEEARTTVRLMDDAYQTILRQVHESYPTQPGRPVAASLVKDLQKEMSDRGWTNSRFLAVNAIVMNPDHRARDPFEQKAVEALARGEERYESLEGGNLRVATVVPLGFGCGSCHWVPPGKTAVAAISWKIPVH